MLEKAAKLLSQRIYTDSQHPQVSSELWVSGDLLLASVGSRNTDGAHIKAKYPSTRKKNPATFLKTFPTFNSFYSMIKLHTNTKMSNN